LALEEAELLGEFFLCGLARRVARVDVDVFRGVDVALEVAFHGLLTFDVLGSGRLVVERCVLFAVRVRVSIVPWICSLISIQLTNTEFRSSYR
jgi:hypothetical protein